MNRSTETVKQSAGPLLRRVGTLATLWFCAVILAGCLSDSLNELGLTDESSAQSSAADSQAPGSEGPDRDLVLQVQEHLRAIGHDPGPVDGVPGPKTTAAIEAYQQAEGLPVDGLISDRLVAELAAAGAVQASEEPQSTAPPEPRYLAGTRYLYSDGEVQQVLAVDAATVEWRSNSGAAFTSHQSFIVPPLSWSSGGEQGHRVLDVAPDSLWQKTATADVAFVATAKTRHGGQPESLAEEKENWRCRLGEAQTVTVVAGSFETQEMICERLSASGSVEFIRTWHYAPGLRHYVRRQDAGPVGPAEPPVELVAILPEDLDWPPAVQAGLDWAMQHALESLAEGEDLPWQSSAVEAEVTIRPGAEVSWPGHDRCRRFQQVWTIDQDSWVFPGIACRDQAGKWHVPDPLRRDRLAEGRTS